MSKVISIQRGTREKRLTFFDAYSNKTRTKRLLEESFFWAGILLSFGVPQFIFGIYGGGITVLTLAGSLTLGIAWGCAMYYWLPGQVLSIFGGGTASQSAPSEDDLLKEAA